MSDRCIAEHWRVNLHCYEVLFGVLSVMDFVLISRKGVCVCVCVCMYVFDAKQHCMSMYYFSLSIVYNHYFITTLLKINNSNNCLLLLLLLSANDCASHEGDSAYQLLLQIHHMSYCTRALTIFPRCEIPCHTHVT